MEMSGQLHAPAALPSDKIPWYPLDRRMGCIIKLYRHKNNILSLVLQGYETYLGPFIGKCEFHTFGNKVSWKVPGLRRREAVLIENRRS
jgi:hypothetical protein